jgi:hypothetical protein
MALTYTETYAFPVGDRMCGFGYLTHDASDTTVDLPCETIDFVVALSQYGTNSTGTTYSWSGHTLTASSSGGVSGRTDYIVWFGTA